MRKPETIEWLYLDFDGFFASVEQQIQPALRGKPIGVTPFAGSDYTILIACSKGDHPQIYHRHYSPHNLCEIFARLLKMDDADVLRVQAFCLSEILAVDSPEVEAIGLLTKPDFGDYWSPDDAFFDILRDNAGQDTANIAGQRIIDRNLNVQPTLKVRQGWRFNVIVSRDLILKPYGANR